MKQKLTITVDAELIAVAKRYARSARSVIILSDRTIHPRSHEGRRPVIRLAMAWPVPSGKTQRPALRRVSQEVSRMILLDTDVLFDVALNRDSRPRRRHQLRLDRGSYGKRALNDANPLGATLVVALARMGRAAMR